MMEHFITKIYIKNLRHLTDINIQLDSNKKQHLLLTGKNGSGKTSLLLAIRKYLGAVNDGKLNTINHDYERWVCDAKNRLAVAETENEKFEAKKEYDKWSSRLAQYKDGIELTFNKSDDIEVMYEKGQFITAFFPANRKTTIEVAHGVTDVKLQNYYGISATPGNVLLKYMVHLKTQQSYARNEGDTAVVETIQQWFDRFESALKVLLDNPSISLEYDYKDYDFKINEDGRNKFSFNQLSDGYSSLINIVSDLIIRMDQNWLLHSELSNYGTEGIVLIDELETHLHIELQKKVLPFLTEFFPGIQFIITTHSPYILNSVSNAKCYDLEKNIELENLYFYSSDELAEGYFDADEYSGELRNKVHRYKFLLNSDNLSEDERAERARLRVELRNVNVQASNEIRQILDEIEGK